MINPISNAYSYIHSVPNFKNSNANLNKVSVSDNESFEQKLLKQNNRLTNSILCLVGVIALKTILDIAFHSKSNKTSNIYSLAVKGFESLKNHKEIPTIETCKSINPDLKLLLENQIAYIKAGENIISEVGNPHATNRILLCGPAGVGKSFYAKIFAKSLDAEYKEILYSDFHARFTGEHLENFKNIFKETLSEAEQNPQKRYVVVFNELDTLLNPIQKLSDTNNKATYGLFKTDERSIFLNYLEEFKEKAPNITVIGTTNILPQSKNLDQAALSRFQNIIEVPYPDKDCIFEALKMNLKYLKNKDEFLTKNEKSLKELAQKMAERKFSFRNLEYMVNEAKRYHLNDKIKDSSSAFKIDYLKNSEKNIKFSDGELEFHV